MFKKTALFLKDGFPYLHYIFMIKEKVPGTVVEIVVFVLVAVVEVVLGRETEKWTKL